jgi:hypothetical protein
MTAPDWRWKIAEAAERLRNRYAAIGRGSGAPFLALVYPPDAETAVLKEWLAQATALRPDVDVRRVDLLEVTQQVLAELGVEAIVQAMADPMPGSDPQAELGRLWIAAVDQAVQACLAAPGGGKLAVSLERLAALYPAAGPLAVMQHLWESTIAFDGPFVVLIPGVLAGPRKYLFLGQREEFMYRGDLL